MTNLFAICRNGNDNLAIKRIEISQQVQNMIGGLFQQQATSFLEGIDEEVPFGGDYKPDTDEMLVLDAPIEIAAMRSAAQNPLAADVVDAANFINEQIRGLFVAQENGDAGRILIQSFTAQQFLARSRVALIFSGNSFRTVTEPSFALDSKLVAIAEGAQLKFKSFHFLKRIFVLGDIYREATDQQIDAFCSHGNLTVGDVNLIKTSASQPIRRLIHAVHAANVLDQSPIANIEAEAEKLGLELEIVNGRIVVPADRQKLKALLRFLDESIYAGPLSARPLLASSKRPFAS